MSEAGSLSEGAAAFDAIAAGGPLTVDTSDLGELSYVVAPSLLSSTKKTAAIFDPMVTNYYFRCR